MLSKVITKGKIYAIDNDSNMVKKAKENLLGIENVKLLKADLLDIGPSIIPLKFDVIFSNAVLHWISDHRQVFRNFYDLLSENGVLLIQCGGYRNLQRAIEIFDKAKALPEFSNYFTQWKNEWNFAKPMDTKNILKGLGYRKAKVYLTDAPVEFDRKVDYSVYLKTVVLGPYLKHLPSEEIRVKFVEEIIAIVEKHRSNPKQWTLDYVRLNIFASR
jgi:trans-aconitate 2-methyltransferase